MKNLLCSFLAFAAPLASGAVLVEYNFENNLDASNPAGGITATALTNTGFTSLAYATDAAPVDGVDAIQGTYSAVLNLPDIQTGFTGAAPSTTTQLFSPPPSPAATSKYFQFTLTPDAEMTVNDLTLYLYGDAQTTANWLSLNLFATLYHDIGQTGTFTEVGTATSHGETAASGRSWTLRTLDGDPGDPGNQSILTTTQATDFRLVITDGGGGTSARWNGLDQIVVNGSVIPEPTSALLMLSGLGLLVLRRRR